ncbi:MAG: hypothetical protein KGN34_12655 [Sphingomonadales bacterium]|nr:hypothetical protein [Sphingomonadales bacterium]
MARDLDRRVVSPAAVITGAVLVLALPSAVLAFSTRLDLPADAGTGNGPHRFAAGEIDPRLTSAMSGRTGRGPLFRFTPAGLVMRADRAVTVAVRVDAATAREITVRGIIPPSSSGAANSLTALRIAPTAYNLGVSRGYQGFAHGAPTLVGSSGLGGDVKRIDMPDLSAFGSAEGTQPGAPPRLAPHIALDERERAGRAPRTLESVGTQTVDLGGSYRVTRNIDVTAGVRYSRDRDRMQPITDGKTDSQAVFVGTQFKF